MGDAVILFTEPKVREKADKELKWADGISRTKTIGKRALYVEFSSHKLSPVRLADTLRQKGLTGVISSL